MQVTGPALESLRLVKIDMMDLLSRLGAIRQVSYEWTELSLVQRRTVSHTSGLLHAKHCLEWHVNCFAGSCLRERLCQHRN